MDDATTTIDKLRNLIVAFRDARNWKQFHKPKDIVLALGIEVGELAELFLWKDEQQVAQNMQEETFRKRLEEEMADVQIMLLCLAAVTDVDLSRAVEHKVELNAKKYPVEKAYGSAAKYTQYT